MTIIMTVAGVNCDAKVLDNEITCRIPKNMTITSEGLPVKVSQAWLERRVTSWIWVFLRGHREVRVGRGVFSWLQSPCTLLDALKYLTGTCYISN